MSLAAVATSKTVLDTILDSLVPLILPSALDRDAAYQAALDLLSDHHPATREELRLAAEVVGFSLQALAALRDAAAPGIPIARAMRLRTSACTLRRAEQAAQRKLDALQRVLQPAEPIQERAIAIAIKNAKSYFDGAYAKAREMGDALIAQEAARRSAAPPAPDASPTGQSPTGQSPTGQSPTGQFPTGQSPAGQSPAGQSPAGQPATGVTPARDAIAAPPPAHPAATTTSAASVQSPGLRPQAPHQSAPSPQTPDQPASPHATAGAMSPGSARIAATLRYMKETLSRMDPNVSETGDFRTDFIAAVERGLPALKMSAPVAPAA